MGYINPDIDAIFDFLSIDYGENYIGDILLLFFSFLLIIPRHLTVVSKALVKSIDQRKSGINFATQSWIFLFLLIVIDNNGGNTLGSILVGQMPSILIDTTQIVPIIFIVW